MNAANPGAALSDPNIGVWPRAVALLALLAVGWGSSLDAWDGAMREGVSERSLRSITKPVSMQLVLYDPNRCVRMGKRVLVREVERIFGDSGIRVAWHSPARELVTSRQAAPLRAVILPSTANQLGIRPRAMGAAVRGQRGEAVIYIFWPNVLRTLGMARFQGVGTGSRDAALAVARVLVHEIVHAALPEMPHRRSLMSARLTRSQLLREGLVLDPETGEALSSWLQDRHDRKVRHDEE